MNRHPLTPAPLVPCVPRTRGDEPIWVPGLNRGMTPNAVVEHLDVLKHSLLRMVTGCKSMKGICPRA